MVFMVIQCT